MEYKDPNIENAQRYLNAMFGGHPDWVELEVDGHTGTVMMEGIIRAFQIHNNVGGVTGVVGQATMNKMRSLPIITKMDPNDDGDINVCLIQCALFAKGYAAGGITGIFYNAGVAAVKEMQGDAGLAVTGTVDWKVWSGLLSLNWFKKVSRGDETVRAIQQQLNGDWAHIIGVGPCDGVMSRQTAFSLVGALQGAEGVQIGFIDDLTLVNFGEQTTAHFPGSLKKNQNGTYIPFNKLVQYALYFYGFDPGRIDGIYDETTETKVREFQSFYGLLGIGLVTAGEVNVSTMKSLLVSKGDTNRTAKACDCSTVLNRQQALDLKAAGYTHVGRYLTGTVGNNFIPKAITKEEAGYIQAAGLSVFPIYQDGGYYLDYFKNNTSQGIYDAEAAIYAAESIGVPANTVIYFAVDFDCLGEEAEAYIIPYFRNLALIFASGKNPKNYRIGIYAPRYICTIVSEANLAVSSFVCDMSYGFSGNLGFGLPANWAFDQFHEEGFPSSPTFPIDKVAYSGRDAGFSVFDTVPEKTPEELLQEQIELRRQQIIDQVCGLMGYLEENVDINITTSEATFYLGMVETPDCVITTDLKVKTSLSTPSDEDKTIQVGMDTDGNLSVATKNDIAQFSATLQLEGLAPNATENFLSGIALTVKNGSMAFSLREVSAVQCKMAFVVNCGNIAPEGTGREENLSLEFLYTITFKNTENMQFDPEYAEAYAATLGGVAVILIIILLGLNVGIVIETIIALFTEIGFILLPV